MRSNRLSFAVAFLLLLIGSARIVSTYSVFNHTMDEPVHLAAGMEWIDGHRYTYEDLHPPLARVSGALGAHLAGGRWMRNPSIWFEGLDILGHGDHYDRILFYGRLGILPFFWLAGSVVFLSGLRLAGAWAAVLSVYFFSTMPSILAHAGLLTTDMALAACVGAAMLAWLYWSSNPNWRHTVVFGVCLALAVLSKFSSVVFLLSIWSLIFIARLLTRSSGPVSLRRKILPFAGVLGIAALCIWAAYLFTFGQVRFLPMRVPAPAFISGLYAVWNRNKDGGVSYLLGETSTHGFWAYFPVTLLLKTPLPTLIFLGGSIAFLFRKTYRSKVALPLIFCLGILLPAMASRINIGTRHVLPIYLGCAVACGVTAFYSLQPSRPRYLQIAVAALLIWQAITGIVEHPDYIAYTNELIRDAPERIFVDSDLDWGQDMERLGTRLNELGVKEVNMAVSNRGYFSAGHPFPVEKDLSHGKVPPPGWSAISLTAWKLYGIPEWANEVQPREKIGRSMYLYYFPE